jgi:hypothetical protein
MLRDDAANANALKVVFQNLTEMLSAVLLSEWLAQFTMAFLRGTRSIGRH